MRAIVSAACVLVSASLLASCALTHERGDDSGAPPDGGLVDAWTAEVTNVRHRLWVLVHPSDAPRGPGLYLYDTSTGEVSRTLALPSGVNSPHGVAWDGHSLWLSDTSLAPSVIELDPSDGHVRSTLAGIGTEGLAADGATLWYAGDAVSPRVQSVVHVDDRGVELSVLGIPDATVQDLALANGTLFYLVNDEVDRIVRIDPTSHATSTLATGVDIAPYALGFDGEALVVAASGQLSRFDPVSGALLGTTPLGVPGWVTAIVFVE